MADPRQMRAWSRDRRGAARRVGLVPTMGYLHEGHLRLIDRARRASDDVVVSVFVNPLQFGPAEDFGRYPRDLPRDRSLASARGTDCLFVPGPEAVYPEQPIVRVLPGSLGDHLCGPWRPGHFEGVLTVVAKLFHLVEPDLAVFGRKDAQQAALIRRMVSDLDFPLEIIVAPTVREADGLALSSRNAYLTPEARRAAAALSRGLEAAHQAFRKGGTAAADVVAEARRVVEPEPLLRLEYVEAVDPNTLAPVTRVAGDTLLALAARVGSTRLIDNIILGDGLAGDDWLERP
ncbi:MAG: pantoate--beta-alanine ligase [Gemmatimonadetes bacterium]|nr:pantoate--beta-alanine ligase [Gemmatimonadota bacterium]